MRYKDTGFSALKILEVINLKRKSLIAVLSIVLLLAVMTSALAAELTGSIWTNNPKRVLGIVYGYYCTAAQNRSPVGNERYALARSMKNGAIIASDRRYENQAAIANSGLTKPTSGYGEYGEAYGKASMIFGAGAYKDY